MKQFYFKSIFLSLLMMVIGVGNTFAADTWVKTAPADLTTGDVVMIVDLSTHDAMSNDKGTSSAPASIYVYFSEDKSECTGTKDDIVPENLQWVVTLDDNGYKFGVSGTTNYLYCTNTNNGVRVGTNSNNVFVMKKADKNSTEDYLFNKATSRYLGVYSDQDWRCYSEVNTNIKATVTAFYKKVESTTPALIAINETNFPDDVFRAWVVENCDKAPEGGEKDGYLDDDEIAAQVIIGINNKNIEDLKGIEYFTAATMLMCDGNKLQTLDVSKNTKLTQLICYGNKLTSLNVSKNTALTSLHCTDNQLTSLNVSNNTELGMLLCQNNQLTSLDVTNNQKLTTLDCSNNLINETEMGKLVASMPTISGNPGIFYPFNQSVEDANVITTTQVNDAKAKNWNVQAWNGSKYVDYDGVASTNNIYTLVTSVSSLTAGDEVIIVNKDAGKAIGVQNSNNRAATAVTFDADGNAVVPASTDIQVFTLEGNSDGWYFNTGSGYIYAASSSSNHLKTETEKDNNGNAKASISFSGEDAAIQFQGTNTRNLLRYNSGSDIFACYASGQSPVQIYSKPVNKKLTDIMLSGEYPTTFFVGDEFSFGETGIVTAVYDDNSTKVVTDNATFSGYDMSATGNQTVTVSYTERGVTKEQTYEITVNNRALSSITLSGDYPTTFNVGDEFSHEGMTVTATYDNNTSEDVTADATFEGYDMNTAGTQTVTVSYTKGDVTKTATYDITVNAVAVAGITLNKEAIQLKVGKTTKLTATVEPDNATDKTVVWSSGDETVATVSEDGTVTAVAEGTATITAGTPDGAKTATCTVTVIAATAPTEYYEKVTTAPSDWSGEYLIVYEDGSVAFDGSLSTLDAAGNTIEVEINNEMIEATDDVNDAAFTIATMEGGYSVKAASGKFIGATSYANSLASSDSEIANSLSLDASGNAVIKVTTSGGDVTLRYNYGSNQLRFRYYKEGQQAIQLYKKATGPKSPLARIRVEGYTTDFVVGDTYTFDGTVTAVYEDDTEKDVTNRATFTEPDMTTAGEDVGVTVSYTEGEVTAEEIIYINVREPETIKFRKITSTDELVAGKRYVLVNEEAQKVIAQYYNLHFEVNDATISDESVSLTEGQANFLTLGGEEGAWTFATSIEADKYLALASASNYLESKDDDEETQWAKWTISFDEAGNAVIQSNYITSEERVIMYNKRQPRFACYTGTQEPVQLYVESDLEDVTLTITAAGYATLYYGDRALKVPEDVTAKTYKVVDGKLAESKTYASGSKIPKGEAVVLKGAPGEYTFKVTSTAEPKDADNQLKGSDEAEETTGGNYYYALQAKSKDGKHGPGMYWMNSTGAAFTNGAHKAYMALDEKFAEAQGMAKEFYLFDEATTGISGIDAASADRTEMYNLNGQRVDRGYKGVVIKNGKKIVIK